MGRPKALLPFGTTGQSFVLHLVEALCQGGAEEALVVGRPDDEALRGEVTRARCPCRYVVNPHPERGQLSSLLRGLDVADRPGVNGVLVTLVDVPFVTAHAVRTLLSQFAATGAPIVRAMHAGRYGHPVIFSRSVFADLRHADPALGAKPVLEAHAAAILNLEVGDRVADDVDTAADYERLFPPG